MYAYLKVEEKIAYVDLLSSGLGEGAKIILTGSTFPVVPVGTAINKFSFAVPEGVDAISLFCRHDGPHRVGSGKTARLDHKPRLSTLVLFSWMENGKAIVKSDTALSGSELAKFNPFVRSETDILVTDAEHRTAYVSDHLPRQNVDPAWTYKTVSMDAILEYITRKLTLEELGERATSEQKARDLLADTKAALAQSESTSAAYAAQISREQERFRQLQVNLSTVLEEKQDIKDAYWELILALRKSEGLHHLLSRLPATLRPSAFDGFTEAMSKLPASS